MDKGEIFAVRFKKECKRLGKSVNQIERKLGYPRNVLHNYKKGRLPSGIRLLELAQYFEVSPQYLVGEVSTVNFGSSRELFNSLSTKNKHELCLICREWYLAQERGEND